MNRRELIVGAGAAAVAASVPSVIASPADVKIKITIVDEISTVTIGVLDRMAYLWGISRMMDVKAGAEPGSLVSEVETDQHLRDRIKLTILHGGRPVDERVREWELNPTPLSL